MAKKQNPSPLRWVGEIVRDVVVGQNPAGHPKMLPVRIIVYDNVKTGDETILIQWIAKAPEGIQTRAVKRYVDKQIRRHVRRWRS